MPPKTPPVIVSATVVDTLGEMEMARVEPDADMAAGTELLDNEVSQGEYTKVDTMCCGCWQKGGNMLMLTDKRVMIKYWDNALGGCIESSVREESFDYEEVVHVKAAAGRPLFLLMLGGLIEVLGFIVVIAALIRYQEQINNCSDAFKLCQARFPLARGERYNHCFWNNEYCVDGAKEQRTETGWIGGAGMVVGVLFLMFFFAGKGMAYVTLDMTKDKEVGSFSSGLFSWDTLKNPFSAIFGAGKPRRHATCVLKLFKKDAFAATSKICAVRQGLKEKLSGVL